MDTMYLLLKFLHVVAASVWVGALVTITVLNARLAGESDQRLMEAAARQSQRIGAVVMGPAAGLTLIAGGATMAVAGYGFVTWIVWGLAAVALSMLIGATVVRKTVNQLVERLATADAEDPGVTALQRRISIAQAVLILLLISAVWVMVFKPV